jgi:hypothetical protein
MNTEVREMLARQLGFLERSCALYDAGYADEALRIAVTLRVLFHDTASSISLLTQLGIRQSCRVLSTFKPGYSEDPITGVMTSTIPLMLDLKDGRRMAPLGDTDRKDFIPAPEWWEEVVMSMSHRMGRRDIVLSASNQDGGAHVDPSPNQKTRGLREGVGRLTIIKDGKPLVIELRDQHFMLIRQICYEVLNSPEIK